LNYLKNYDWKSDPNKTTSNGLVFVHDRYPNNEIHLFDDGRVEHIVKGRKVGMTDSKRIKSYLAGFHKY
jgi:hypothetical protein